MFIPGFILGAFVGAGIAVAYQHYSNKCDHEWGKWKDVKEYRMSRTYDNAIVEEGIVRARHCDKCRDVQTKKVPITKI